MFIISMLVVLNHTKVLRRQSLGNNVVYTICYYFNFISYLLLFTSMSSQLKITLISKGINQNYLYDLLQIYNYFTTLLLCHCERTVSIVLGNYLLTGNYPLTHVHLSSHFSTPRPTPTFEQTVASTLTFG